MATLFNSFEKKVADANAPIVIGINGKKYDVRNWVSRHPGGDVLLKYEGKDATAVFDALHAASTWKKLDAFEIKDSKVAVEPPSKRLAAFTKFKQEVRDAGLMKVSLPWIIYKTITTLMFVFMAPVLVYYGYSILAAISLGIGFQQLGWLGHDYCHHTVFENRTYGRIFGYFLGNVANGLSQTWWNDRHNSHHAITNVLDSDPDVDNMPVFAWDEHDLPRVPSWARPTLIYQHYYFIPFLVLLKAIWCLQSLVFAFTLPTSNNRKYVSYANVERLTLVLHWTWYLTLVYFAEHKGWFVFISQAIPGFGIAIVVFFNHYGCHHYVDCNDKFDFLDLVLVTTQNMTPGVFTDWICGGLNYQIEHHMFPTMPRNNLHKASFMVKKFCKEQNLDYQCADFIPGLGRVIGQLRAVSEQLQKVESHAHSQ